MAPLTTYVALLYESAKLHPSLPALQLPEDDPSSQAWRPVSYAELTSNLDTFARYWAHELESRNIPKRSIVGVWLKGTTYLDYLTIWGVTRAGYIPQLISLRMTSQTVVHQMMASCGAKALIHDPSVDVTGGNVFPMPCCPILDVNPQTVAHLPLPDMWMPSADDDVLLVYNTSGSSKGIPKPVPTTARFFRSSLQKTVDSTAPGALDQRPSVNLIGSFAHNASMGTILAAIRNHGQLIFPHQLPFPTSELQRMIEEVNLNVLFYFSSFLSMTLVQARRDPALLASLRRIHNIIYGGLALDRELEAWAINTAGLRMNNLFASTEVGMILTSDPEADPASKVTIFKKLSESSVYEFVPLTDGKGAGSAEEPLLELLVLPESLDCPHSSLVDPTTGKFHTGDLFVEVAPGRYVSKGRNDDWIKMQRSLRCDTGAIEANALEVCGEDLVSAVVVCGVGQPCPVMLFEPIVAEGEEAKDLSSSSPSPPLRSEILRRILPFHERRYDHERITDEHLIVVVPKGSLPRTAMKGNIQRKLAETKFAEEISRAYEEAEIKA